MRKILVLVIVIISLTGCGHKFRPMEIDYVPTSIEEYKINVKNSRISSSLSGNQLLELMSLIGSSNSVCIGPDVIVLDDSNTTNLLNSNYDYVNVVTQDELIGKRRLILKENSEVEYVISSLETEECLAITDNSPAIPITEYIKNKADEAVYKEEFVKSLKEVLYDVH